MTRVRARLGEAAAQPDRSMLEDAFGVAALFLLLFVGLSLPCFA